MVESDPVEQPGGPPSLLQKALAGWELSEQQGETQSLSQRGWTLKKYIKKKVYNALANKIINTFVRLNQNGSC